MLTCLILNSQPQTSRGPSGLPGNPTAFPDKLNLPPSLQHRHFQLSLTPQTSNSHGFSTFSASILVSYFIEKRKAHFPACRCQYLYRLPSLLSYTVYTHKQWQPLYLGGNLIPFQGICSRNSSPFLLHQFCPSTINHICSKYIPISLTVTLSFSHCPITLLFVTDQCLQIFVYASVAISSLPLSLKLNKIKTISTTPSQGHQRPQVAGTMDTSQSLTY